MYLKLLTLKKNLELAKFIIKRSLESKPALYILIAYYINKLKGNSTNRIVSNRSTVCVEGFPRSANSFAYTVLPKYWDGEINIATHLHSSAQIIQAVKLGIPTIVLVRKPDDCILSLRALIMEDAERKNIEPVLVPVKYDIQWYIDFYNSIKAKKQDFVIARFEDVVTDFNKIVKLFNYKYNTTLPTDLDHQVLQKAVFQATNFHLSPSLRRDEFKEFVKREYYAPDNMKLIEEANNVYQDFIASTH